jgi:hypothetical protein
MLAFFFCVCLTANEFVCKLKLCSMWNWNLCTRGKVCERGGALCWFVGIWIAGGQVGHSRQRSLMQILTQFQIPKRNVFSQNSLSLSCFVLSISRMVWLNLVASIIHLVWFSREGEMQGNW